MRTPPVRTPVIVTWEDALGSPCDQYDTVEAALKAYRPTIRRTIGYWLGWARHNGARAAALAIDDDRSTKDTDAFGGVTFIPYGMVRKIVPGDFQEKVRPVAQERRK